MLILIVRDMPFIDKGLQTMVEFENTNLQNYYSFVVNHGSTYATILETNKIACHLKEKV